MKKLLQLSYIFLTLPFNILYAQPAFELVSFGTGFNDPVGIANSGDDRLFIVEQGGVIKILNADGNTNTQPFLDIDNLVRSGGEQGLLGLAFHPNYNSNGFFYVNYTNNSGNTVIARYSVSSNPDMANSSSGMTILTIDQPLSNHNGGDIAFGPDGYLYIPTGDGGGAGDPQNRAQNLSELLGKLLRIDVDNGTPYSIPTDNPYLNDGDPNTLPEIWAYGLRNPWRFSFDRQTGDIWIGDVGQNQYDEINMVSSSIAGINYGWRCYEGNVVYDNSGCPTTSTLTFPVGVYSLSGSPCAISGGYVYRGTTYPNFIGIYFFADYCSNEIGTLEKDGSNWVMNFSNPFNGNNWSSLGEDVNGELYIAGKSSGTIFKIVDNSLTVENYINNEFNIYPNPAQTNLYIKTKTSESVISKVYLYDIQGRLLKKIINIANQQIELDIKNLNKGIYFVKVFNEKGNVSSEKFIIQ